MREREREREREGGGKRHVCPIGEGGIRISYPETREKWNFKEMLQ
jgi:hypothetical protein